MNNNILTAEVLIKGTSSLLWHRFDTEAFLRGRKDKCGTAGNNPDEWKNTVLVDQNNQLYIEPSYIFGCIREGAKYTLNGLNTLQNYISATLHVLNDKILIDRYLPDIITTNNKESVFLDVRSVRNPSTGARNIRYRVCSSSGWLAKFLITWDRTLISKSEMNAIIIDAGRFSGIGDARNIGYGRFKIDCFEVVNNA